MLSLFVHRFGSCPKIGLTFINSVEAKDKAMQFLKDLVDDALDKTVITTMRGEINLTTLFQQLLWEFNQHGGQMAYLRGMLRGIEDSAYTGGVLP